MAVVGKNFAIMETRYIRLAGFMAWLTCAFIHLLFLPQLQNRLRVERFLARVDRGGGNLLEAALEAGFGSYAQFHRVFRRMLGVNPHEYVTGRDHDALVPARHRA